MRLAAWTVVELRRGTTYLQMPQELLSFSDFFRDLLPWRGVFLRCSSAVEATVSVQAARSAPLFPQYHLLSNLVFLLFPVSFLPAPFSPHGQGHSYQIILRRGCPIAEDVQMGSSTWNPIA